MVKSDRSGAVQFGALPYRIGASGETEVMLLTLARRRSLDHPERLADGGP